MSTVQQTVYLQEGLWEAIEEAAQAEGRSRGAAINFVLAAYVADVKADEDTFEDCARDFEAVLIRMRRLIQANADPYLAVFLDSMSELSTSEPVSGSSTVEGEDTGGGGPDRNLPT